MDIAFNYDTHDFIDQNLNKSVLDDLDIDDGTPMFVLNARQFTADPTPISNICFPKNTIVTTDQGNLFIENILQNYHTIDDKRIVAVTKTTSIDKYLVCFEKDAIGIHCPIRKTMMSKDHKIRYKGKWIESYKFLGNLRNVHVMEYSGEILYNVLMDEHSAMNVNGLMCETLHPDNVISQLHKCTLGKEYKNNLIIAMNACILKNDYESYKQMSSRVYTPKNIKMLPIHKAQIQ